MCFSLHPHYQHKQIPAHSPSIKRKQLLLRSEELSPLSIEDAQTEEAEDGIQPLEKDKELAIQKNDDPIKVSCKEPSQAQPSEQEPLEAQSAKAQPSEAQPSESGPSKVELLLGPHTEDEEKHTFEGKDKEETSPKVTKHTKFDPNLNLIEEEQEDSVEHVDIFHSSDSLYNGNVTGIKLIIRQEMKNYTRYRCLAQVEKMPSQRMFSKFYSSRPYLLPYTQWLASEGIYHSTSVSLKTNRLNVDTLGRHRSRSFTGTRSRHGSFTSQGRRGSLGAQNQFRVRLSSLGRRPSMSRTLSESGKQDSTSSLSSVKELAKYVRRTSFDSTGSKASSLESSRRGSKTSTSSKKSQQSQFEEDFVENKNKHGLLDIFLCCVSNNTKRSKGLDKSNGTMSKVTLNGFNNTDNTQINGDLNKIPLQTRKGSLLNGMDTIQEINDPNNNDTVEKDESTVLAIDTAKEDCQGTTRESENTASTIQTTEEDCQCKNTEPVIQINNENFQSTAQEDENSVLTIQITEENCQNTAQERKNTVPSIQITAPESPSIAEENENNLPIINVTDLPSSAPVIKISTFDSPNTDKKSASETCIFHAANGMNRYGESKNLRNNDTAEKSMSTVPMITVTGPISPSISQENMASIGYSQDTESKNNDTAEQEHDTAPNSPDSVLGIKETALLNSSESITFDSSRLHVLRETAIL